MPESLHTPGPWLLGESLDNFVYALDENKVVNRFYLQVERGYTKNARTSEAEIVANTRLIAAAPDLLDALDALAKAAYMATCEDDAGLHHLDGSLIDAAWKAIRKAKGKVTE